MQATDVQVDACVCTADGFCPRFGREMVGRMRQICRGDGIDPAARRQYLDLWAAQKNGHNAAEPTRRCPHAGAEIVEAGAPKLRECGACNGKVRLKVFECRHPARAGEEVTAHEDCRRCDWRPVDNAKARKIILINRLSPGDVLAMTAAVWSLHEGHPGKYRIAVDTSAQELWEFNPGVEPLAKAQAEHWEECITHYPLINQCNQRAVHFLEGYCDFLAAALGVKVPLLTNRPKLWLSRQERGWINQVEELSGRKGPFWLVNAGYKSDYTTKFWGKKNYQRVVDLLAGRIWFVQVGSAEHHHPPLDGVLNLVGRTSLRQLVRLAWHAQGGLGGVTLLQHLMAAWQKPYACIMGGREPVQWNAYPTQQLFHTVGMLPCCRTQGCWKSRVRPIGDGAEADKSLCEAPVFGAEPTPACMALISPEEVAAKILLISRLPML